MRVSQLHQQRGVTIAVATARITDAHGELGAALRERRNIPAGLGLVVLGNCVLEVHDHDVGSGCERALEARRPVTGHEQG